MFLYDVIFCMFKCRNRLYDSTTCFQIVVVRGGHFTAHSHTFLVRGGDFMACSHTFVVRGGVLRSVFILVLSEVMILRGVCQR